MVMFVYIPPPPTQLLGVGLIAGGSYLVATGTSLQVFSGALSVVGLTAIIIVVGIVVFVLGALGIIGGFVQRKLPLAIVRSSSF